MFSISYFHMPWDSRYTTIGKEFVYSWCGVVCEMINRWVSQMRALLAACRDLAVDYSTLPQLPYVLNIKRNKWLSMLHIPALWYFDTSVIYPQWRRGVKFVMICEKEARNCKTQLLSIVSKVQIHINPDNKVHEANMGPTWVLSAPDGSHVGPVNFAIREFTSFICKLLHFYSGLTQYPRLHVGISPLK